MSLKSLSRFADYTQQIAPSMLNKITLAAVYAACINCSNGIVCSRNILNLLLMSGANLSMRIAVFKRL
jgi:hypothetical protein